MAVRTANAVWEGGLQQGAGNMKLGSGALEVKYSFSTRFEEEPGTNPEELIGAAHAGCFSMAFSGAVGRAGFEPQRIETNARVHLDKMEAGFRITRIELQMVAEIPGIDQATFLELAEGAKQNCPVSQALAGVEIELHAELT